MDTTSVAITLGSAAIAAGAGLFGARMHVRASVRSTNRQEWINRLRLLVADLIAQVSVLESLEDSEVVKARRECERLHRTIELMSNPKEEEHRVLLSRSEDLVDMGFAIADADLGGPAPPGPEDFYSAADALVKQSQLILKAEWERVKRGK